MKLQVKANRCCQAAARYDLLFRLVILMISIPECLNQKGTAMQSKGDGKTD